MSELYRAQGLEGLRPADKQREYGLMKVLQMLQNGQLKIFTTLHETLKEIQGYARDEKGDPVKYNDHLMDALRYAVVNGLPRAQIPGHEMQGHTMRAGPQGWMRN